MHFDILSDFHCEMNARYDNTRYWEEGDPKLYAWHEDSKSKVLVLAGDSSNSHITTVDVIREASWYYEHIVFVDGNHEHYSNYRNGMTVMQDMEYFNTIFNSRNRKITNVTYLNGKTTYKIGETLFIGANGWYNFLFTNGASSDEQKRAWKNTSNDPVCINFGKQNTPEKIARRQTDQLRDLVVAAQDDDSVKEIVVVTHTLPTETAFFQFANPTHPFFPLNGAFCNNWMHEVWEADTAKKIKVWCFGHTHDRRDFFENDIHFVCNPRGYRGEKKWGHGAFQGIVQVDTEEVAVASAFGEVEP